MPTWPQLEKFRPRFWWVLGLPGLPLSMQSSMLMQAKNAVGSNTAGAASSVPDLAPSWRPKSVQNRSQNAKKSILKNNMFSRSIFGSPGHGFREVFGSFFGPQSHSKSNLKKNVREPFCTVKTNTKSMSALLLQRLFEAKIDEKSLVCWNIDFGGVLERFWEGFG